jgi:hypothetical protein
MSFVLVGRIRCAWLRKWDYLLSDDFGFMTGLDFEAAVLFPKIDGYIDAGNPSFVNLYSQP